MYGFDKLKIRKKAILIYLLQATVLLQALNALPPQFSLLGNTSTSTTLSIFARILCSPWRG
jgi:hypothetical protein